MLHVLHKDAWLRARYRRIKQHRGSEIARVAVMRRYFGGPTGATKDVLVAVAMVDPGKTVHKAHRHAEEEYWALVAGSGTWTVDGKQTPARRGDILYAAPWVYHGLTNTSDKPLIFLVVRYHGKGPPPPQPDNRPNNRPWLTRRTP